MIRLEPALNRRVLTAQLLWFLLWVGTTAIALWLRPEASGHGTHMQLGLPPCPSALMFARPCPGCGLTTSFTATVHLALVDAWNAHPFGPFLYLGFTATAILAIWAWWKRSRVVPIGKAPDVLLVAFATIFVVFGVWRFMNAPTENYGARPLTPAHASNR